MPISSVLEQSAVMAKRAESEKKTLEEQVDRVVQLAWLRMPGMSERTDFVGFAKSRGLPALCRLLLNSNEFLFID